MVCSKYGGLGGRWSPFSGESLSVSNFWQGILSVAAENPDLQDFFLQKFKVIVGNGRRVRFWIDRWINNQSLSAVFPRLFSLSVEKDGTLFEFFHSRGVGTDWNIAFRRLLLAWEEEEVLKLNDLLQSAPRLNEGLKTIALG